MRIGCREGRERRARLAVALLTQPMERPMTKPMKQQEMEEKSKKKPGGQQHPNPPKKTSTDNPERNPRDQKGRGGSK